MARPCMTQPVRILLSSTDMLDPKRCHIHPHARREGVPEHRPVYPTSHPTDFPTTHHTHVIWSHPHRRTRLQPARTGKKKRRKPAKAIQQYERGLVPTSFFVIVLACKWKTICRRDGAHSSSPRSRL